MPIDDMSAGHFKLNILPKSGFDIGMNTQRMNIGEHGVVEFCRKNTQCFDNMDVDMRERYVSTMHTWHASESDGMPE
eukprot:9894616-Alexandrium_andersonii.AAC.1